MFLHPVDTTPPATAEGDCPIRRDLAVLAAGLDTPFLRAGATLATAIEVIDRMIAGLEAIAAALDPRTAGAAVADMRDAAERFRALPDHQRDRAGRMAAVDAIAKRLNEHVLDIHQILRVLGIYGTNIKIAASGEDRFVGFVERMTVRLGAGERHLAAFVAQIKTLRDSVAGVRQGDRLLAAESANVLPAVPARLAADAVDLAAYLADVAGLAKRVAAIARDVQGKVAVVLGALQVGDSTRQRLEHVVSALQMLDVEPGADGAVRAHVDRLLAAQIEAALADFLSGTAAMMGSLAELGPDATRLHALIAEQDGGGGRALLARIDQGIADVERVTTRLRVAETRSRAMVGIIADAVGDLSSRLKDVGGIRLDMQDIATNMRLMCRRHGAIGKAVSVIAVEVDAYTLRLGDASVGVADAIAGLGAVEGALRGKDGADDRDIGDTLASALAVVRRACHRVEEVIGTGGDDARELAALLAGVADELAAGLSVREIMETAARTLACRTAPADIDGTAAAVLRTLLPGIGGLHTMASEREVHARFLLPGMEPAAPPSMPDDDDDDGLF